MDTLLTFLLLAVLLFAWNSREFFTEPDPTTVVARRPKDWPAEMRAEQYNDATWLSRIDAQVPFNPNYRDYITTIQAFYDKVYAPSSTRPTDKQVEAFLQGPDLQGKQVDKDGLRKILVSSFKVDVTTTAAAREEKQQNFKPSDALQPNDGVLELWKTLTIRGGYKPADSSPPVEDQAPMPEGVYEPISQTRPLRDGQQRQENSTSWTAVSPYNVCLSGPCTENVL